MLKFLIPLVVVVVVFIWWRFFYISRPTLPPLSIAADDPLMREAMAKAQEGIALFRELAAQPNRGIRVKIPFVSNSGMTEFLWAEVLSVRDSEMEIRYLTPPVRHTGRLERLHTHPLADLVDWQVESESGKYAGGFTMRVMFIRAREQWGNLPPELEAEETKYE